MDVRGQRHAEVTWRSQNWQLINSRTDDHPAYPMGAMWRVPLKPAVISISYRVII
ncbi:hypothetical protein [Ignatzschineria indica]|uniref:hypothetical protein n=1 Tax=Ignatzschineria indica TaxID=472583 RepID=UPI003630F33D